MSVWRRIARLFGQSRIRLPRAPLTAGELSPGDWVQLGSERWRVARRRLELDTVVFWLRPLHGSGDATLTGPRRAYGKWTLESDGSAITLAPEVLLVFPSGVT